MFQSWRSRNGVDPLSNNSIDVYLLGGVRSLWIHTFSNSGIRWSLIENMDETFRKQQGEHRFFIIFKKLNITLQFTLDKNCVIKTYPRVQVGIFEKILVLDGNVFLMWPNHNNLHTFFNTPLLILGHMPVKDCIITSHTGTSLLTETYFIDSICSGRS